MKKITFLSIFVVCAILSSGQNFDKVKTYALLSKFEDAKNELDKLMVDPKAQAKPDGWGWKAKIYSVFYKDSKYQGKYPNAEKIADEAFDKYIALDPSLKFLKENAAQDAIFDLYIPSFNNGIGGFNAKKWDSASYYFDYAVKYSDVIFKNKLSASNATFDTNTIIYAGYSAQNLQKPDKAIKYYTRLMESKVGGENLIDIYRYALQHTTNTKNLEDFNKYLGYSKAMYPNTNWEDYEIDYLIKNNSLTEKIAIYTKEDASGSLTYNKYIQFGDMFVNIPKADKANLDSTTLADYQYRAADAFKKAASKNPSDGIAPFNAGVIYYNIFGILDDRVAASRKALQELNSNYKDKAPEKDPKKKLAADAKFKEQSDLLKKQRLDIEKPASETADLSIEWLEKAFAVLKDKPNRSSTERSCLNKTVDFLGNIYQYKRDKASGKDPKAYDAFDAKFKLYDGLHGKY